MNIIRERSLQQNWFPKTKDKLNITFFIGPESDQWLCLSLFHSLTDSLTDCRLVILIDVTLVCKDGNSKLIEVVTVVDVDDEKQFITDLVALLRFRNLSSGEACWQCHNVFVLVTVFWQIWELRSGHKAKLMFRL